MSFFYRIRDSHLHMTLWVECEMSLDRKDFLFIFEIEYSKKNSVVCNCKLAMAAYVKAIISTEHFYSTLQPDQLSFIDTRKSDDGMFFSLPLARIAT